MKNIAKSIIFTMLLSLFSIISFAQKSAPVNKLVPVAEFFTGGQVAMYTFIDLNLKYPPVAKRNRMQGECIVSLTLDEKGKITAATIVKNIGGGCGEEAVRLSKL